MQIAVLTFDRFNELDSFVAAALLNRLAPLGWRAWITAPTARVASKNGIVVDAQRPLEFAAEADAVIVGSGMTTDEVAEDGAMLARMPLDPARQLIASQCSGALILKAMGLLDGVPVCTDAFSQPLLAKLGARLSDRPFHARGNVATAGGCLSSQYIATWLIGRRLGLQQAAAVIDNAAPVGEKPDYVARALAAVRAFVEVPAAA